MLSEARGDAEATARQIVTEATTRIGTPLPKVPFAPNVGNTTTCVAYYADQDGTESTIGTHYGFKGVIALPTTDPRYQHLKAIHIIAVPADGVERMVCVLVAPWTGTTLDWKSPVWPRPTTDTTMDVEFRCLNDNGITANAPFTAQDVLVVGQTLEPLLPSSVTFSEVSRHLGQDKLTHVVIECTATLPDDHRAIGTEWWLSKDGGVTYAFPESPHGWLGTVFGTTAQFEVLLGDENGDKQATPYSWVVKAVTWNNQGTNDPDDAVVSDPVAITGYAALAANLITDFTVTEMAGGPYYDSEGRPFWGPHFEWTNPTDPTWFSTEVTVQLTDAFGNVDPNSPGEVLVTHSEKPGAVVIDQGMNWAYPPVGSAYDRRRFRLYCTTGRLEASGVAGVHGTKQTTVNGVAEYVELTLTTPAGAIPYDRIPDAPVLPSDAGLLAHWSFDEGSGTVAHDGTGNGNTGAITDATYVAGKSGTALSFNGTTAQVTATVTGLPTGNADRTVSLWFKLLSLPPAAGFFFVYGPGLAGQLFGARLWSNGTFNLTALSTEDNLTSPIALTVDGLWHHMVCEVASGALRLYLDGELLGSLNTTSLNTTSGTFYVGQGFGYFVNALIDEVRIYNVALTSAEVRGLYAQPGGTPGREIPGQRIRTGRGLRVEGADIEIRPGGGLRIASEDGSVEVRPGRGVRVADDSTVEIKPGYGIGFDSAGRAALRNRNNSNIIQDFDFSSGVITAPYGASQWWYAGGTGEVIADAGSTQGGYVFHPTTNGAYCLQDLAIRPGQKLNLTARVYTAAGTDGTIRLKVEWYNKAGDYISATTVQDTTGPKTAGATLTGVATAPANANTARVEVLLVSGWSTGNWYVDFVEGHLVQVAADLRLGATMGDDGAGNIIPYGMRPVAGLPSLPSAYYPAGTCIHNILDHRYYRTEDGSAWVATEDPTKMVNGALASGVTLAASQITAGTLIAGVQYAGQVNATQVNAGEFNGFTLICTANSTTTAINNAYDGAGYGISVNRGSHSTWMTAGRVAIGHEDDANGVGSFTVHNYFVYQYAYLAAGNNENYNNVQLDGRYGRVTAGNVSTGHYITLDGVNDAIKVNGNQVLGVRKTGWTAATGTASRATFDTSTVTTEQLAQRFKALEDDLISHGLIGT
jgi:hypothetical protein